jgi:EpsD family peptidyl-prolyl cis-trans isomerase
MLLSLSPIAFLNRSLAALLCASICFSLAGCGNREATATQVVASVDGEEISVHQINDVLAKSSGLTPENLPKAKVEILNGLVEQQLAINLASSQKLDRSPEVVAAIERAKREIIARAALEHLAAALPKPTDEEARKYYAENPALFSQRRVFSLQEMAVRKPNSSIDRIRTKVASAKTMEDVQSWLKENNIEFSANSGVRPAEQVPLEILPQLQPMKDGQITLVEGNDAFIVMRLVASRSQPVPEDKAFPAIKTFLFNQRTADAIKVARVDMKAKAKISYFGEFAGGEVAFKAKAEADAQAATQAATMAEAKIRADSERLAEQKAEEQAAARADADARSQARAQARAQANQASQGAPSPNAVNLEKGLKGLK